MEPASLGCQIPPMILQTLVENGIKHGISKYPEGGEIRVVTRYTGHVLNIRIYNTGQIQYEPSDTGFGLINTRQRLELLFGNKAIFRVSNSDSHTVLSEIIIHTT